MNDLRELYQQVIVDHNRCPRNFCKLDNANRTAEGFNPLCGDTLTIYFHVEDGIITDVGFEGKGCAISIASASLMTEQLKGKTEAEAEVLFAQFHGILTKDEALDPDKLGKLIALAGVKDYPMRVKCATLAWHAAHAALDCSESTVTTE